MNIHLIRHGSGEHIQMLALRDKILRAPLGLSFSPEDIEAEKNDMLIVAFDNQQPIGCCILTPITERTVQLRQMCVEDKLQGRGVGNAILEWAENLAKEKGFKELVMHAREVAVDFYRKAGYQTDGKIFYEVTIPHVLMRKDLGV